MLRFFRLLRLATWRAFEHDQFAVAKASAYSSILTFFPALLVVGSVLATLSRGDTYLREVSYALGRILPAGSATAIAYLRGTNQRPVGLLISTSLLTLWTASGTMISWMEGFRNAYAVAQDVGVGQGTPDRVFAGDHGGYPAYVCDGDGGFRLGH